MLLIVRTPASKDSIKITLFILPVLQAYYIGSHIRILDCGNIFAWITHPGPHQNDTVTHADYCRYQNAKRDHTNQEDCVI